MVRITHHGGESDPTLCPHREAADVRAHCRASPCTRWEKRELGLCALSDVLHPVEALNLSPRHKNKKKPNLFFPEIAQISSAAIGTSLVIRTSVHFNLTLAEEPGAYLSLKTFFCINVMTSESFFAYFQYRTEAGTSPRKDLLFGWVLVCCSDGVIAYKSPTSCLQGGVKLLNSNSLFFNSFFEIHNFIHRLKEQCSKNYLTRLQEN